MRQNERSNETSFKDIVEGCVLMCVNSVWTWIRNVSLGICLIFTVAHAGEPQFSAGGPHNFGVLVRNSAHTIYRSAALGSEGLADISKYLKAKKLPFPKTIIHMNSDGYKRSFFHPTLFAIEEQQQSARYGYKFYHSFRTDYYTYLAGENPYEVHKNINHKKRLNAEALVLFGFDEEAIVDGGIDAFYRILDLVLGSEGPVLFHCTGGRHRTGMIAMAIRYLQGGEWRKGSYRSLLVKRDLNAAQYEYMHHNPVYIRTQNFDFIDRWSKDPLFEKYEELFQESLNLPTLN